MRFFSPLVNIMLPDLGEGTKEATIKEILVKPGQKVEEYEDLCEVFTDKLVAKIPSTASGIVKDINFTDDSICAVGHPIMTIETDAEAAAVEVDAAETPATQSTQPVATNTQAPKAQQKVAVGGKSLSTPAVRHYAKGKGVDINQVQGTGPNGRVTRDDINLFINQPTKHVIQQKSAANPMHQNIAPLTGIEEGDTVKQITGMKKAMTKAMTEGLSIPFFTFSDEIDATKLIKLRKDMKEAYPKLTMLPFLIKACSIAMVDYPVINSQVDNELDADGFIQRYVIKHAHNFSIAIDGQDGLTVPNIKNVQDKSIMQIDTDLKDLVDRAKNNTLKQDDFADATFSVSSVGNIGGRYFVPTILRPQAAIIAIGKAHTVAKWNGTGFEPAEALNFSISADHRIVDGATIARFSQRMKTLVENPNLMLLNMH